MSHLSTKLQRHRMGHWGKRDGGKSRRGGRILFLLTKNEICLVSDKDETSNGKTN